MSTTRKVLTIIFSILIIGALAFVITWGIINWSKVKEGMSGNGLYTQDDVQNAYEDGYNTALTDKEEYDKIINSYKDTITTQNDLISQHASEANALNKSIQDYQGQITLLNEQKTALKSQIETLNTIKANNEATITDLNVQIAALSNQVLLLQANKEENANQINALNGQIANLQTLNNQLQENNELNLQTITGLNGQIASLNEQIEHLHTQIQTNLTTVTGLNERITELQNSVAYYEQYIAKFETDNKVTVTFEFAGSVYNLQLVEKGSKVSVPDPTSTEYLTFNGWTVDNQPIDLSTFVVNEKVTIVADVTYRFSVKFVVEGEVKSTQIVEQGQYVEEPAKPRKTGYTFDYWTYGDAEVFFDQFPITQNTTFIAKFTRLYDVSFVYEGTTLTTRRIKENTTTTPYAVTSTEYKVFNGWAVNGTIVSVNDYRITADTVFVADISYNYDVKFMADDIIHNRQTVALNSYATRPTNPVKDGYEFMGWSIDGTTPIDLTRYVINQDTVFTAMFKLSRFDITFKDGSTVLATYQVDKGHTLTSVPTGNKKHFAGWAMDGITVMDVSSYVITGNTTFVSVYAGLYETGTDILKMTWQQLEDDFYFDFTDGCLMYFPNTRYLDGDLILPTTVRELGNNVFENCVNLTGITITGKLTDIDENAFSGCTNLTTVNIVGNVGTIGDKAFYGCKRLDSIVLKNTSCINLGSNVFFGCSNLDSIRFEFSTTEMESATINIKSNTFANIPADLKIYVPYDVYSINYDENWQKYSSFVVGY